MECYVCLDKTEPLYKVCNCNSVIHKKCLLELLKKTKYKNNCSICMQKYNINKIKINKGWIIDKKYFIKITVIYLFTIFYIITLYIMLNTNRDKILLGIIPSILAHLYLFYKYKKFCCISKLIEEIYKIKITRYKFNELETTQSTQSNKIENLEENLEEEFELMNTTDIIDDQLEIL